MAAVEENNRQAAERLRRLANENLDNKDINISISYEEVKPKTQAEIEVDIFKKNLISRKEKSQW